MTRIRKIMCAAMMALGLSAGATIAQVQSMEKAPLEMEVDTTMETFGGTDAVAYFEVEGNKYYLLPNEPAAPLTEALPFQHLPVYRLVAAGDELYDPITRVFRAQLVHEKDTWRDEAVTRIQSYYKGRRERNPDFIGSGADAPILPRQIRGYEVSLIGPDGKEHLIASRNAPGQMSGNGIPLFYKVSDESLHEALVATPPAVQVNLRVFFDARQFKRAKLSQEQTFAVSSRAIEEVAGDGNALIVGRQGVQRVCESAGSLINVWEIAGDESMAKALRARAAAILPSVFEDLVSQRSHTLADLRAFEGERLLWTTATGALELKPRQIQALTTALESKDNFRRQVENEWHRLSEMKSESRDYEDFHKKITDSVSGGGGFSFMGFGLSASAATSDSDDSQTTRDRTRYLWEKLQEDSKFREELVNEAYKNWTGEEFIDSTEAKALKIAMVRASDLAAVITQRVTVVREVASGQSSQDFLYQVAGAGHLNFMRDAEIGTVSFWESDFKLIEDANGYPHHRATVRVKFDKPFRSPPKVMLGMIGFDFWSEGHAPDTTPIRHGLEVKNIDETGFDLGVVYWHQEMRPFASHSQWHAFGER